MHFLKKLIFMSLILVLAACSAKNTAQKQDETKAPKKAAIDYSKATKTCYLTFDDGPHVNDLKIMNILAKYDAKATFFYNAYKLKGNEGIVRKVVANGHSLGNHSYSHKNLQKIAPRFQYIEIKKNQDMLSQYGAVNTFRPGFGASTYYSRNTVKTLGMREVLWDVDTFDWRAPSVQYIIDRAARAKNHPKPVILMHSTANKTVQALPEILKNLKAQGCRFKGL